MRERRCEDCKWSSDHKTVKHDCGSYVRVRCNAPAPAVADLLPEARITGHKAAIRCEVYEEAAQRREVSDGK